MSNLLNSYGSLTPDEQMVYAAIEAAGTAGIWTKNIKARSNVHAKVLDGVYKSLEKRGLIKPMKSVKFPQRKMYIRNGLTPSEEATGGTWFNDGKLDEGMLIAVSQAVETYASLQSWREKDDEDEDLVGNLKRKQPATHQDEEGRGKTIKLENGQPAETVNGTHKKSSHPVFEPQPAGYQRYPTLNDFSRELRNKAITQLAIPNNALRQLLDVMVYDNRLYRLSRQARSDEQPDDVDSNTIYMYKSFTTPAALGQRLRRRQKIQDGNEQAMRAQELEDIGTGGFSEVPCLGCPVFDICGDGGPVNIRTCVYMNPWKESMEEADREAGDRWPADPKLRRVRLKQAGR